MSAVVQSGAIGALIGLCVGIVAGAVPVYNAWRAADDDRARRAAMARHPAGSHRRLHLVGERSGFVDDQGWTFTPGGRR